MVRKRKAKKDNGGFVMKQNHLDAVLAMLDVICPELDLKHRTGPRRELANEIKAAVVDPELVSPDAKSTIVNALDVIHKLTSGSMKIVDIVGISGDLIEALVEAGIDETVANAVHDAYVKTEEDEDAADDEHEDEPAAKKAKKGVTPVQVPTDNATFDFTF